MFLSVPQGFVFLREAGAMQTQYSCSSPRVHSWSKEDLRDYQISGCWRGCGGGSLAGDAVIQLSAMLQFKHRPERVTGALHFLLSLTTERKSFYTSSLS